MAAGGDWDVHWGYDLAFAPWPYNPRLFPGDAGRGHL